jgi:hypothetical protein
MGRYILRVNIRYVRVHTSMSDYLLSTRSFFLLPPEYLEQGFWSVTTLLANT